MKKMKKKHLMEGNSYNSMIQKEDEDFLEQVAALEADALTKKRRKISSATATPPMETDGLYTAALRGTHTLLLLPPSSAKGTIKAAADSCFKCGRSGHWARDCVDAGPGLGLGVGGGGYIGKDEEGLAQKQKPCPCPCGLGPCVVLTANTDKNRGRKFYKCPLTQDAGGCSFFEWCDAHRPSAAATRRTATQSSVSFPDMPCPCGSGSCLILTAKTGKNVGRQFYRCPKNQGSSCGFFKWCDDQLTVAGGVSAPPYKSNYMVEKNKPSYDLGSGSACFKCGKGGHWAKDCSTATSNCPAEGQRPAPPNTCYKCNQGGHWARDCPSSQ